MSFAIEIYNNTLLLQFFNWTWLNYCIFGGNVFLLRAKYECKMTRFNNSADYNHQKLNEIYINMDIKWYKE